MFESRNYAVSVQDKGFIVLEYNEGEWAQSSQSFFSKIKLTESQRSELIIENEIIDISIKDPPEPHILILSSGEMTPFEWRISDKLTQSGILLQGNVLGGVLMTGPEPLGCSIPHCHSGKSRNPVTQPRSQSAQFAGSRRSDASGQAAG